jgi:hypothetical protein
MTLGAGRAAPLYEYDLQSAAGVRQSNSPTNNLYRQPKSNADLKDFPHIRSTVLPILEEGRN